MSGFIHTMEPLQIVASALPTPTQLRLKEVLKLLLKNTPATAPDPASKVPLDNHENATIATLAAAVGDCDQLDKYFANLDAAARTGVLETAAANGHVSLLEKYYSAALPVLGIWNKAAIGGHINVLRWAIDREIQSPNIEGVICNTAAVCEAKSLTDVLTLLADYNKLWPLHATRALIARNQKESTMCAQWSIKTFLIPCAGPWDPLSFVYLAARSGNVEMLKFLVKEIRYPDLIQKAGPQIYRGAIEGGHYNILQWAVENKCQWSLSADTKEPVASPPVNLPGKTPDDALAICDILGGPLGPKQVPEELRRAALETIKNIARGT